MLFRLIEMLLQMGTIKLIPPLMPFLLFIKKNVFLEF